MLRCFGLLCLVTLMSCGRSGEQNSSLSFGSGEHLLLGNQAYEAACQDLPVCPPILLRADAKESFYYGELVALSGDFYDERDMLYTERQKPWYQFFGADSARTKAIFYREVASIQAMMDAHSDASYPDLQTRYTLSAPNYVRLSEENYDHFGFYNSLRYLKEHDAAVELALEAHALRATDSSKAQRLLQQALFRNSFADHYLSDGFASGHIRNPRTQTRAWAEQSGWNERTAGILTKLLHDRDGEIRASGEHGLPVVNARGDRWFARCDSQLFYHATPDDFSAKFVIEAIAISLREVLLAYAEGTHPSPIPEALNLLPFPAEDTQALSERFNPQTIDSKALYQSLKWYLKIPIGRTLSPDVIAAYLGEIPRLMQNFRDDVRLELEANPLFAERLPEPYRTAFTHVR